MPELSAICSKGRLPSIAAASSKTESLIRCAAMILIALTALSPGPSPTPKPAAGNSAPGFKNSPRTFKAWAYSTAKCCRSQFVDPANCCTWTFDRNGAKSRTACARSSSPDVPSRLTMRPSKDPVATKTLALSTPYENPARMETSKKASSDTTWSRTCHAAAGCLRPRSSRNFW